MPPDQEGDDRDPSQGPGRNRGADQPDDVGMDFRLGAVSPAYRAIESHTIWRLRRWLCRKYKVRSGKHVRFSNERLYEEYGLTRLEPKTKRLPWAKA